MACCREPDRMSALTFKHWQDRQVVLQSVGDSVQRFRQDQRQITRQDQPPRCVGRSAYCGRDGISHAEVRAVFYVKGQAAGAHRVHRMLKNGFSVQQSLKLGARAAGSDKAFSPAAG